jgi:putative ATP-binding cassette transporter
MDQILPKTQALGLLSQVPKLRLAVAIFASALGGVAEMGATICVLEYFRSSKVLWWQFTVVVVLAVAIGRYSQSALGKLASRSVIRLRRRLIRSVLHIPLLDLERIGSTRLLVAFTNDAFSIGSAVRHLATLVASAAFLLAALAYIGWLAPKRMIVAGALCLLCIGGAVALRQFERRHRLSTREALDNLVHVYGTVLDGIKQLKLDRPLARRALRSFEERVREQQQNFGMQSLYSGSVETWIQVAFYLILGTAAFGPFGDETSLKVGYGILALLLIRRPLRSLIVDTRAITDASVAFQRINEIGFRLAAWRQKSDGTPQVTDQPRNISRLDLEQLFFRYGVEETDTDFALGPLEISLHSGEVVFVVGDNGSGKTTLAKLLTGLYEPTSGAIRLDGVVARGQTDQRHRSNVAAVFGDFCLFEGVADLKHEDFDERATDLAAWLKLERWRLATRSASGKSAALSSGERRRIALLMALLQDRPIFMFDEWASDQDPRYKDFFYYEVVPHLRNMGKLVIVISHDEGYFHTADRILRLERDRPATWMSPLSFVRSTKLISPKASRSELGHGSNAK